MKITFELNPQDQREKKIISHLIEFYNTELKPARRSYHPLDLLNEAVGSLIDGFASLVGKLVYRIIKPRK